MGSSMDNARLRSELDQPMTLTPDQVSTFREQGFIKLKNVLSPQVLECYGSEITRLVLTLNTNTTPLEQRNTYQKAFLQVMNLWRHSEVVKEFVFSKRLAKLAADLMGVRGIRLYHDQALYKEPGGGITPWHADQFYWPLSNSNTVTIWIPLQATSMDMGPLAFSVGSHKVPLGRNLGISDESEKIISKTLLESGLPLVDTPFDLGEVSFHYGWTFHRAGPNQSTQPRKVMTVIYMEDGIKLIQPQHKAQEKDWNNWLPGAKVGEVVDTPLNPVLYHS
ncbi:MAG: phytanoyl-CoA dioxygenase family protein [Phycisphaerales bacterium]|nr:phytanoyl-CoA dioxygenase family protein [Phycisphaerales bacterium]